MPILNLDLTSVPKWVSDKIKREQTGPSLADQVELQRRIEDCKRNPFIEYRKPRLSDLPPYERRALLNPGETKIINPTNTIIVPDH